MPDRRTDPRNEVVMEVVYSWSREGSEEGRVSNISRSGMFVETARVPEEGTRLSASLNAEHIGKVVWIQGRVIRRTPYGMAVRFTSMDTHGIEALVTT